jgi:ArsR family transcriptional regulator
MLARAADMIKCLGHPLRLRLVEGLEDGERSVTALQAHADAPQAQVSQQLASLKARGIVGCRREGTFVYYRIIEPRVYAILSCIRACDRP